MMNNHRFVNNQVKNRKEETIMTGMSRNVADNLLKNNKEGVTMTNNRTGEMNMVNNNRYLKEIKIFASNIAKGAKFYIDTCFMMEPNFDQLYQEILLFNDISSDKITIHLLSPIEMELRGIALNLEEKYSEETVQRAKHLLILIKEDKKRVFERSYGKGGTFADAVILSEVMVQRATASIYVLTNEKKEALTRDLLRLNHFESCYGKCVAVEKFGPNGALIPIFKTTPGYTAVDLAKHQILDKDMM